MGGRDLGALSDGELTLYRRREAGLVFQFFNLLPHITVRENVELPLALDGRADAARRAQELLDRVGLLPRAGAHPYELSGGEMQRVAIARALSSGARLLLADEPTGNLDSANGEQVLALLDEIRRERGVTLILATHSPAAASRAERIVEIRDGRSAPMKGMALLVRALVTGPARRRPQRAILPVVGVAIGVAAVAAIQHANRSVTESFREAAASLSGRSDFVVTGVAGVRSRRSKGSASSGSTAPSRRRSRGPPSSKMDREISRKCSELIREATAPFVR